MPPTEQHSAISHPTSAFQIDSAVPAEKNHSSNINVNGNNGINTTAGINLRAKELVKEIENTFDRDAIFHEATSSFAHLSDRNCLFISHIIQKDLVFNTPEIASSSEKKRQVNFDGVKAYTKERFLYVVQAIKALHKRYYKVSTSQTAGFKQSERELVLPLDGNPFAASLPCPVEDESMDSNDEDDTTHNHSKKQKFSATRSGVGHRVYRLYCNTCAKLLFEGRRIQKRGEKVKDFYYISSLSFGHDSLCQPLTSNLTGVFSYKVNLAVLDASKKLIDLAKCWWDNVSTNSSNSILFEDDRHDNRFYGLFYNVLPYFIEGLPTEHVFQILATAGAISSEEAQDFLTFHEVQKTDTTLKKFIMELIVLFLEDFKFIKHAHKDFEEKKLFLSACGFIAGGRKVQILHKDITAYPPRRHLPDTPVSLLIPIADHGRDLYIHGHDEDNKFKIPFGSAVCFDGNVLHSGAKSKREPLGNLALHIHVDSLSHIRTPNLLDLHIDNNGEEAWDSDN